ncbi:hypothetical protein J2W37_006013 [Variovorax paradoxus]|uniref:Uncharacterized protein n=1 Tax=Variovorax paradoxus TaxID=34073 RepID=A0AAE3Y5I6_VARPD|nr:MULTISPECIES: hypothetical protein [Variovorax]MBD9668697.1 hypothetical protein [Variovorax sp. VRV01]MDP9968255.1 hypothetical protein [Variovorax paradoxus]MDR6429668.1 hypothetical protein [Variovorax paradoxus]MDR6456050.1 hypothetical protein [Variovorax paradoxus]
MAVKVRLWLNPADRASELEPTAEARRENCGTNDGSSRNNPAINAGFVFHAAASASQALPDLTCDGL